MTISYEEKLKLIREEKEDILMAARQDLREAISKIKSASDGTHIKGYAQVNIIPEILRIDGEILKTIRMLKDKDFDSYYSKEINKRDEV